MPKDRGDHIPRASVCQRARTPYSGRGKLLQLSDRTMHRPFVRSRDALIRSNKCKDGNVFRRRKCEVVKDAPIRSLALVSMLIQFTTDCFSPLRQQNTRLRMKVFAQAQKLIARHPFAEPEHGRTFSDPLPRDALSFAIIITNTKMLLKILFGILEVVLSFGRQHGIGPQLIAEQF